MTLPDPIEPLRVVHLQNYYVVKNSKDITIAQGSFKMCELIAARRPLFVPAGDLFDGRD